MGTVNQEQCLERIADALESISRTLDHLEDMLESCRCKQGNGSALVVTGAVYTDNVYGN